jgi:hypothetical protein
MRHRLRRGEMAADDKTIAAELPPIQMVWCFERQCDQMRASDAGEAKTDPANGDGAAGAAAPSGHKFSPGAT